MCKTCHTAGKAFFYGFASFRIQSDLAHWDKFTDKIRGQNVAQMVDVATYIENFSGLGRQSMASGVSIGLDAEIDWGGESADPLARLRNLEFVPGDQQVDREARRSSELCLHARYSMPRQLRKFIGPIKLATFLSEGNTLLLSNRSKPRNFWSPQAVSHGVRSQFLAGWQ